MPVIVALGRFFDKEQRRAALKAGLRKTLVDFVEHVQEAQKQSTPAGNLYKRGGFSGRNKIGGHKAKGKGTRIHRASARGQRPAIDSGKLNRSTKKKILGAYKGEVTTIAKTKAGFDYAAQLQDKMDRPIQSDEDVKFGERLLGENVLKELAKL